MPRIQARWSGAVIAESEDVVTVEGNAYLPPDAVKREHLRESATRAVCPWKGAASYYDVVVGESVDREAARHYSAPHVAASHVRGRVALWRGVTVIEAR